MLFRASNLSQNLLWKVVRNETNQEYKSGIDELMSDGWEIIAIVADGKPGLRNLYPSVPFQMCQFHQFQIVTRYISKKPKLQASQELREIMFHLKETDFLSFQYLIEQWQKRWCNFLAEKTINPFTGKSTFTHKRIRQAYYAIQRNLDYLFTFQYHSEEITIPNTTNSIDGYFSHLKKKIAVHQGASKHTQINLISELIFR